jgi:hypothetical protein
MLVVVTAAKKRTKGAPVRVNGASHVLRVNVMAIVAMPKRYRNEVF